VAVAVVRMLSIDLKLQMGLALLLIPDMKPEGFGWGLDNTSDHVMDFKPTEKTPSQFANTEM
jgi:hypothetical protein